MADIVASRVGAVSTSTGTGSIALGAALANHQSFGSVMADGDTCEVVVIDDVNTAWLRCVATYVAAGPSLTRTTFIESSTGSNVSFAAGTKTVILVGPVVKDPLEAAGAALNYYVRTDGSDSNNGLANTSGGAWLTIQHALDVAAKIKPSSSITINVAAGTYAENIYTDLLLSTRYERRVEIIGTGTVNVNSIDLCAGYLYIENIDAHSSYFSVQGNAELSLYLCSSSKVIAQWGARMTASSHTFSGSIAVAVEALSKAYLQIDDPTCTGTPAYSTAFASAEDATIVASGTVTGSATGSRYSATKNGIIDTAGGGASYLPGNSAGSTATQGQYL